jgi:ABC-2 type transport system permease protein
MENLLATPVRPFEVMLGKILPYIAVGYMQVTLILLAARWIFHVPLVGSLTCCTPSRSCSSRPISPSASRFRRSRSNQLQAVQMAFFFFLPSILLSGFMFPFRGMPEWAQWIGSGCRSLTSCASSAASC